MTHLRVLSAGPVISGCLVAIMVMTGCLEFHTRPDEYPASSFGHLDIDGLQVHYRDLKPSSGQWDETVVMIHGYAGGLVSWTYNQPHLASRYRTVSLDLKGFGLTDKPAGEYTTATQVELVLKVMDRLEIPRAHLVAHSWGCAVAIEVARRAPERVDKLILAAGYVYPDQQNGFLRWSRLPIFGEVLFWLFYEEQLEARYTWGFFQPRRHVTAHIFDVLDNYQDMPGLTAAALAVARGMDLEAIRPHLGEVHNPALLLWGDQDRVSPPLYGARLASDLAEARLVVLERAGHNLMVERAGTFNALAMEFLEQ